MVFSSASFLYFFLPVVLILHLIVPGKAKNVVLLLSSLLFYFMGEPIYTVILIISSLSDYLFSLFIAKRRGTRKARWALVGSLMVNIGLLGFFKYADFLIGTVNAVLGTSIPLTGVPLPIGISFFTFQTMSYTIDVYLGNAEPERRLDTFATYVSLFPQLVAGPIVRYTDVARELEHRKVDLPVFYLGVRRFVMGLAKKLLLAGAMGELCEMFRAAEGQSVLFYWLYAIAYTLQIYLDFSAYSDMAIGLGKMLGFDFPENFNYPYLSRSVTEFWRRWHMTLGGWFRDYVYIPLGGNRCSRLKWLRNIAAVWLLTGLWHGAAWNFVVWGGMFGVLLVIEKFWLGKLLAKGRILPHIYVMFTVIISFVIFNGNGMSGALQDLGGMFGLLDIPFTSLETLYYLRSYAVLLIVCIAACFPVWKNLYTRVQNTRVMTVLEPVAVAVLLIVMTASLVDGSFNPFLYFRF